MASAICPSAVARQWRNLIKENVSIGGGGNVGLLSGNFRQTLPVALPSENQSALNLCFNFLDQDQSIQINKDGTADLQKNELHFV